MLRSRPAYHIGPDRVSTRRHGKPRGALFRLLLILSTLIAVASAACQPGIQGSPASLTATPLASPTPTNLPKPPLTLTVCMGEEPSASGQGPGLSLFPSWGADLATRTVLEAVYDGPIDSRGFGYQPVILESLPTLENGGALLQPVEVKDGDRVLGDAGVPIVLAPGEKVRPAGCREGGCSRAYSGGTITMDQLVVSFRLRDGLRWSDGAPLTADDSVYAFEVASSSGVQPTPLAQQVIERTSAYEPVDARTVRWTGLPGYLDPQYSVRFWSPLPRHAYGALAPKDLLQSDLVARKPLGWGPYMIEEWQPGRYISLKKNPYYWRASEGLPAFDAMVFRFIGTDADAGIAALLAGECDVLDQTIPLEDRVPLLLSLQERKLLVASITTTTAWEHADFDLQPLPPALYRNPRLFADVRTRRAIALCMDRKKVADQLFAGTSSVPATYLSPLSPLYNADVAQYPFDPEQGKKLLEQVGWKLPAAGKSTTRVAVGVAGVALGTPLRFSYWTVGGTERQAAVETLAASLAQCGVDLQPQFFDSALLQAGLQGAVFGRQFEVAQYATLAGMDPACELYLSSEIPSAENGWIGQNETGFGNADFDAACIGASEALPGTPGYAESHRRAEQVFAEQLPSIPLYMKVKASAARPDLVGLALDPTASTGLWNLEQLALAGKE